MLLLLDAAAALAATATAAPLVLRQVRLRSDRRWRRHQTALYAACLRNIDRLEHELGIGVDLEQQQLGRVQYLTGVTPANLGQIARAPYMNLCATATMAPGRKWFVDEPDNIRYLRPVLDHDDDLDYDSGVNAAPANPETA